MKCKLRLDNVMTIYHFTLVQPIYAMNMLMKLFTQTVLDATDFIYLFILLIIKSFLRTYKAQYKTTKKCKEN